ncbi:hypothetical protein V1264_016932 [Littorina saxatilis]|uniref:Glycoprotein-N-acetylgalactosamine 3-beta-galactosyltransferase 1 n=2 Tax=Littorina saxatilis TaxID=31220 RepID=A0AAN9BI30_9CAEN
MLQTAGRRGWPLVAGVFLGITITLYFDLNTTLHISHVHERMSWPALNTFRMRMTSPSHAERQNDLPCPDLSRLAADDDDTVSKQLEKEVRVLVWVMTHPDNHQSKARVVRDTWGRRVNKLLFISSINDSSIPTIAVNVSEGRKHLTAKSQKAWRYVYENHFHDADWFMKADDNTYVIMENLRYFLSGENTSEPVHFGHLFKTIVKQGFYSGGSGYVLSKEALRRWGEKGKDVAKLCRQDDSGEDNAMGQCMESLGVRVDNSTDALGRTRFHCLKPEHHVVGQYPAWYHRFDANGATVFKGREKMSDYAIAFHYIEPWQMEVMEYFVYQLTPYGIVRGLKHLNQPRNHTHLKVLYW